MTRSIVVRAAIVAITALGAVTHTSAACVMFKSLNTYNFQTGLGAYWHSSSGSGPVAGLVWQLGSPGTYDGDGGAVNCKTIPWLYILPWGITANLDLSACGAGCPADGATLAVLAQHQPPGSTKTMFLLDTVTETPASFVTFDYSVQGDHNLIELPRPRVVSSSRAGTVVNLNLSLPTVAGGLYGPNAASAVTGYVVRTVSSATRPNTRLAAAYGTILGTFSATGGTAASAPVSVDCSNIAIDQWLVTQLSLENGGILSDVVSEPTQVKCNPALADPKYKLVPKRHDTTLDH